MTGRERFMVLEAERRAEQTAPIDAGRWLTVTLIELAKRFLGMAAKAGFTEARQKHECPKCGWRG
jgi:hypothetical protein